MIRPYEERDLDDLLKAWTTASAVAHPFLSAEFLANERRNIANLYLPNAETWVWETDGRVVGFIALVGNEIGGLFLDPDYHGKGIGRALVAHARKVRNMLEVEVFEANALGRAFYAKCGFVQESEQIHAETGLQTLRLRLAIGQEDPRIG